MKKKKTNKIFTIFLFFFEKRKVRLGKILNIKFLATKFINYLENIFCFVVVNNYYIVFFYSILFVVG